jgi:hypothetical protein
MYPMAPSWPRYVKETYFGGREIETSQFADDTAAFTSNGNISYAVSNLQRYMSDLETFRRQLLEYSYDGLSGWLV